MTRSCASRFRIRRGRTWSGSTTFGPTLRAEIEHFFAVYEDLEAKPTGTEGFRDLEEALTVLTEARRRAGTG